MNGIDEGILAKQKSNSPSVSSATKTPNSAKPKGV